MSRREFDVAIGARVVQAEGRKIQVVDDDGREIWLTPERRIKAMLDPRGVLNPGKVV